MIGSPRSKDGFPSLEERLSMQVSDIGLSDDRTGQLNKSGIFTVRDLLDSTREDLLLLSSSPEGASIEDIYDGLRTIGFVRWREYEVSTQS